MPDPKTATPQPNPNKSELEKAYATYSTEKLAPAKTSTTAPTVTAETPNRFTQLKERFIAWLNKTALNKYRLYMERNNLHVPLSTWFASAISLSLVLGIIGYFLFTFIGLDNPLFLGIILLLVGLDLTIGYPIFLEMQRIDAIEAALPDALKQIADILQAGGTYEFALRELQNSEFGPLNTELDKVLRKLDQGDNMENSLRVLATDNESKLVQRTVTIIIDALKTGAGLSEILDQIADDIREMRHIARERKSRTLMGILLIIAAGVIVAPSLFGINMSVLEFMIKTILKTNVGTQAAIASAKVTQQFISFVLVFYIFIEIIATSIMISLTREGKATKTIVYAPILLLIGYLAYYGTRLIVAATILRGV